MIIQCETLRGWKSGVSLALIQKTLSRERTVAAEETSWHRNDAVGRCPLTLISDEFVFSMLLTNER